MPSNYNFFFCIYICTILERAKPLHFGNLGDFSSDFLSLNKIKVGYRLPGITLSASERDPPLPEDTCFREGDREYTFREGDRKHIALEKETGNIALEKETGSI